MPSDVVIINHAHDENEPCSPECRTPSGESVITVLDESAVSEIEALRHRNTGPSFGYTHELCVAIDALCATVKHLRAELERGALCEECEQWEYNEDGSCRTFTVCGACWNRLQSQVEQLTEDRQAWLTWADGLTGNQHYLASKIRAELQSQLEQLRTWKESAMTLLSRYDSIAETFGGKLGSSKIDNLERGIEQLRADRDRLLRGEFTDDELQGFCHNLSEQDRDAFFQGCTKYQERLFGTSAIAQLKEKQ